MIIDTLTGEALADVLYFNEERAKGLDTRPGHYMHFRDIADILEELARHHQIDLSYVIQQLREYKED